MKTDRHPESIAELALVGVALALMGTALLLVLAQPADAQTRPDARNPLVPGGAGRDWSVRLGAGALFQPEYEGADEYAIAPAPLLMVNYRDLVFLRGPMLGANAFTWQGSRPGEKLQAGPLIRYRFGRDEGDSDDLRGLGDIDGGVEAGGFVSYSIGPWSTGLTVFQDISGSHDGLMAKFAAGHRLPLAWRLTLRSEISATWADENYTATYFGVTAAQSARSGLRPYRAEGGLKDAGITLDLDYSLTPNWGITARLGYKRMLGDAADSPLVKDRGSPDQFTTGLFVGYRF